MDGRDAFSGSPRPEILEYDYEGTDAECSFVELLSNAAPNTPSTHASWGIEQICNPDTSIVQKARFKFLRFPGGNTLEKSNEYVRPFGWKETSAQELYVTVGKIPPDELIRKGYTTIVSSKKIPFVGSPHAVSVVLDQIHKVIRRRSVVHSLPNIWKVSRMSTAWFLYRV